MKKAILATILLVLLLPGCQLIVEQSQRELADNERARTIARNYLEIAPMQIGFIRGYMGERTQELPLQAISAIIELEQIASVDPNTVNDLNLGYSLGLRCRITESIIRHYIPELQRYWR